MRSFKVTLVAMLAALAMVIGMGATFQSANAAYPNTVKTKSSKMKAPKKVKAGKKFVAKVKIRAGNAKVGKAGTVVFKIGKKKYKVKVNKNGVAKRKLVAPQGKKGKKIKVKYTFKPKKGSIYKKSKGKFKIRLQ